MRFPEFLKKIKRPKKAVPTEQQKHYAELRSSIYRSNLVTINEWMNHVSLALHFLLAAVINFAIEAMSRHSVTGAFNYLKTSPLVFAYNTFMIFTTFTVVYFLRRRVFARMVLTIIWLLLGLVNGIMLSNRVTPFNGADLKVAMDAITMINQYFNKFEVVLIGVFAVAVVVLIVFAFRVAPVYKGKRNLVICAVMLAVNIAAFGTVTDIALDKRVLSNYFGNIAFAYQDYGLPYCFYSSVFKTGIDQPEGYSEELIDELTGGEEFASASTGRDESDMPNIIVVQLESFFDPTDIEGLELSKDPIPNFRNLMANYSSGYFKAPSVGAGTANTEFEVLTGMSMRYFGPGEYPYKTIMKQTTCDSAAYALKNFGYGTHAMHNNGGNFYSRAEVFANMGFDDYTSKEFMNILDYTEMGWAKDDILIRYMNEALDSTPGQDFLFTITVQGHGSYPTQQVLFDPEVEVTAIKDESMRYAVEYYVNMQYEVDQFIGNLLRSIQQRGEDTVVVFYGDHLPTMGFKAEDLKSRYLYNTEYVIWDNIGLEKKDQNIFAYQLLAEVMDQLDIHAGTVFNYHQNRKGTRNYLSDLQILQYDMLYGEHYSYPDQELHEATDMAMGLYDAEIVSGFIDRDGVLNVVGRNFTNWSRIYINDDKISTVFVNDTILQTKNTSELEDGDIIKVCQLGSKNTIFRSTKEYVCTIGEDNIVTLLEVQPEENPEEDNSEDH